jgi:hypothetical protein
MNTFGPRVGVADRQVPTRLVSLLAESVPVRRTCAPIGGQIGVALMLGKVSEPPHLNDFSSPAGRAGADNSGQRKHDAHAVSARYTPAYPFLGVQRIADVA